MIRRYTHRTHSAGTTLCNTSTSLQNQTCLFAHCYVFIITWPLLLALSATIFNLPLSRRSLSEVLSLEPSTPLTRLLTPDAPWVHSRRHLLVLSHSLQGPVEDFKFLQQTLNDAPAARSGMLLVYASSVNVDKTHDGITLGRLRLAKDICRVIR